MLVGSVRKKIQNLAESGIFFDEANTLKLFGVTTLGDIAHDLRDLQKALESAGDINARTGQHKKNYHHTGEFSGYSLVNYHSARASQDRGFLLFKPASGQLVVFPVFQAKSSEHSAGAHVHQLEEMIKDEKVDLTDFTPPSVLDEVSISVATPEPACSVPTNHTSTGNSTPDKRAYRLTRQNVMGAWPDIDTDYLQWVFQQPAFHISFKPGSSSERYSASFQLGPYSGVYDLSGTVTSERMLEIYEKLTTAQKIVCILDSLQNGVSDFASKLTSFSVTEVTHVAQKYRGKVNTLLSSAGVLLEDKVALVSLIPLAILDQAQCRAWLRQCEGSGQKIDNAEVVGKLAAYLGYPDYGLLQAAVSSEHWQAEWDKHIPSAPVVPAAPIRPEVAGRKKIAIHDLISQIKRRNLEKVKTALQELSDQLTPEDQHDILSEGLLAWHLPRPRGATPPEKYDPCRAIGKKIYLYPFSDNPNKRAKKQESRIVTLLLKHGFSVEMQINKKNREFLIGDRVKQMEFPHLLALWGRVDLLGQYCKMGYDPNRFFKSGVTIHPDLNIHAINKFTCLDLLENRVDESVREAFSEEFGATGFGGGLYFPLPRQHLKPVMWRLEACDLNATQILSGHPQPDILNMPPCSLLRDESGQQVVPLLLELARIAIANRVDDQYLSGLIAKLLEKGADPLAQGVFVDIDGHLPCVTNTLMFLAMKNYPLSLQAILDYAEVPDEEKQAAREHLPKPLKPSSGAGKTVCACLAAMAGIAVTAMAVNALFLR